MLQQGWQASKQDCFGRAGRRNTLQQPYAVTTCDTLVLAAAAHFDASKLQLTYRLWHARDDIIS